MDRGFGEGGRVLPEAQARERGVSSLEWLLLRRADRGSGRSKVRKGARAVLAAKTECRLWVQKGDHRRNARQRQDSADTGRSRGHLGTAGFDDEETVKQA